MGCDIHLYKEAFVDGKWVEADIWEPNPWYDPLDEDGDKRRLRVDCKNRFSDRNYELFGLLSKGVRHEEKFSFVPRGLPFDVSPLVAQESESWRGDGHSHSYLYLHELVAYRKYLNTKTVHIDGMKDANELKALRESLASPTPDWSLLFPYCGYTNIASYERFSLDVPASFYVGSSLDKIIAGFDNIPGENHRIVFFFDN